MAKDKSLHKDNETLCPQEMRERRLQWLRYHDQQTGGIMGLQPLARGLPLRITKTSDHHKDKGLFKNKRCTLHGWQLHPVDQARLEDTTERELALQHMPLNLFVRIPGAT